MLVQVVYSWCVENLPLGSYLFLLFVSLLSGMGTCWQRWLRIHIMLWVIYSTLLPWREIFLGWYCVKTNCWRFFSLGLWMECTQGSSSSIRISECVWCLKETLRSKYSPNNSSSYTARIFQCMVDVGLAGSPSLFIWYHVCSKDSYVEYKLPAGLPLLKWLHCLYADELDLCLFDSLFFFLFSKAWLDLLLNSELLTALIILKGSPWARKKMIKLVICGTLKPGLLRSVSLQVVPWENLREVFTCAGECFWELPGHIKSIQVHGEISQTVLKCHGAFSCCCCQYKKLLYKKKELCYLRTYG